MLSQGEVTTLIESTSNLMHRAILMTLYATGMRRAELCQLKVSDIDKERMVIHIRQGKGQRDRDVDLSESLLETLREYWRWMKPKTYLFPGTIKGWRADVPITGKVVWAACREAADRAGIQKRVYPHLIRHCFSCRNRHCPKCQANARNQWLAARSDELLGVSYFRVVFTLPHELSALALQNKRAIYDLLFQTSAATLNEIAADPQHLGAEIGFLSVLHTWGQNLQAHPHVHCVIPAGGLSPDHSRWIHPKHHFFLPVKGLSRVFRGKFVSGLKRLFRQKKLRFHGNLHHLSEAKLLHGFLRTLFRQDWVVYAKPLFGGPEHVLHYLARYPHRVAISSHRLISLADGKVTFRWKDYAHGNKKRKMAVTTDEFLRRFLLHVLPRGFVRIRHFGFLSAPRRRESIAVCRRVLAQAIPRSRSPTPTATPPSTTWSCPCCGGAMIILEKLTVQQIRLRSAEWNSVNSS